MSDAAPRVEDPLLTSARREMQITLGIWAVAAIWTLGVCLTWGYDRQPGTLTFLFGFPDWVFWGIIVPWLTATIIASNFALNIMQDAPLEPDQEENSKF